MTGAMGMLALWALSKMRGGGAVPGWPTPTPGPGPSPTPTPFTPAPTPTPTPTPFTPAPTPTPTPTPAPTPALGKYKVQAGDTGEKIALKFTGEKGRWVELKGANPSLMKARVVQAQKYGFPIYAGDVINLPATWAGLAPTPTAAAAIANAATQTAAVNPTPAAMQTAAKATQQAAKVTTATNKQVQTAAKAPTPWPQAVPKGLPPFPSGWEPDTPVRPEVSTRAWQLLPILWKRGKGATAVETIKGRWITFQAQDHGGGKKGVTAYRVKGGGASGTW